MKMEFIDVVSDNDSDQIVGAMCLLKTKQGEIFIGNSTCHPDDMDYFSSFMAADLARWRALIEKAKYEKKEVFAPKIKLLENLKDEMLRSSKVNPKSVEMKKIYRKIKILKRDSAALDKDIAELEKSIATKIKEKLDFTEKLKSIRGIEPIQPFFEKTKAVLGGELK